MFLEPGSEASRFSYILFSKLLNLGSWSSWGLFGGPGASLGCLGCLGLPAAFLGLSWRSPGARLVHSWAVVVKVVLVVVVVFAAAVVIVVVDVGRTRGCWSGWWFGVRWVLVGFGLLGVPWLIEVGGFTLLVL